MWQALLEKLQQNKLTLFLYLEVNILEPQSMLLSRDWIHIKYVPRFIIAVFPGQNKNYEEIYIQRQIVYPLFFLFYGWELSLSVLLQLFYAP